jgi:hypothetical protein
MASDDAHRRRCLKLFAGRGDWPESHYGPRAGMPGCYVPSLIDTPLQEGSLRAVVAAPLRRPEGP